MGFGSFPPDRERVNAWLSGVLVLVLGGFVGFLVGLNFNRGEEIDMRKVAGSWLREAGFTTGTAACVTSPQSKYAQCYVQVVEADFPMHLECNVNTYNCRIISFEDDE